MPAGLPNVKIIISGIDKFSRAMAKPMKTLNKLGKSAQNLGRSMTKTMTLPILGLGVASTIAATNINKGMANVATLIPKNTQRIEDLRGSVQSLAIDVGKSTTDISSGLFQIISAFGDSADSAKKLEINARAAVAGQATTTEAISLTSAVTKAFGDISIKTTQKVADLAFKANELGQTTFPEMASSMGRIAPLSASLGVKMEEMFGVIATGTGVTGNTSEVATQLSSVLTALIKPTTDMQIAFSKLGVKSGKALIEQRGLQGAMVALEKVATKYDVSLAKLLGRKEGLILTTALNNELAETFTEKLGKMSNAAGAAEIAFNEQANGINKAGFAFDQLKSRLEVLLQRIGQKLLPILTRLGEQIIIPLLQKIEGLNDAQLDWIIKLAGILMALGPIIFLGGKLMVMLSGLYRAFMLISGAVQVLIPLLVFLFTNPIGLIITGIGLLIVGAFMLIKHWAKVKKFFVDLWKGLPGWVQTAAKVMLAVFNPVLFLVIAIVKNFDKIKSGFGKLKSGAGKLFGGIKDVFTGGENNGFSNGSDALAQSVVENRTTQSENSKFAGVLKIENLPPGSQVNVEEGGGLEVQTDSGFLRPGFAR